MVLLQLSNWSLRIYFNDIFSVGFGFLAESIAFLWWIRFCHYFLMIHQKFLRFLFFLDFCTVIGLIWEVYWFCCVESIFGITFDEITVPRISFIIFCDFFHFVLINFHWPGIERGFEINQLFFLVWLPFVKELLRQAQGTTFLCHLKARISSITSSHIKIE